ncbi:MAG: 4Fe-4S dicluster domain-containing protein [Candidatus Hecatellales archaeon]|nr:MAG: 4Fe-4S dicluster domain-containing protein [Candidatus Hecatellales archaeon]
MQRLVVIPENCSGCRACAIACSIVKEGVINLSKSRIYVESQGLKRDKPIVCVQCEQPTCVNVCPTGAIRLNEQVKCWVVDEEACNGCGLCVEACKAGGAVRLHPERKVALKCDLCGGDPECVKYCLTNALIFVKEG